MAYQYDYPFSQEQGERLIAAILQLNGNYDFTDASSIVNAIRSGNADKVPLGSIFTLENEYYGTIPCVVRRRNVDKVLGDEDRPTITFQTAFLLSTNGGTSAAPFQFDRPEAFYYVSTAIPAGTVCKFTTPTYGNWAAGDYMFTATDTIAVGSRLAISAQQNTALTSCKVNVYESATATSTSAQYAISASDGTETLNLGIFGTDLNVVARVSYGSNNYGESAIHQLLNGDGVMSSAFEAQTPYDLMPTAFTGLYGVFGGFSEEVQGYMPMAKIHCITNNVYEETTPAPAFSTGTAYAVGDLVTYEGFVWRCSSAHSAGAWKDAHFTKVSRAYGTAVSGEYYTSGHLWLPSRKEIYGTDETTYSSTEVQLPYYANIGTTNHDKLMYAEDATSPSTYWLRDPNSGNAVSVRNSSIGDGGALNYGNADISFCVAPLGILA